MSNNASRTFVIKGKLTCEAYWSIEADSMEEAARVWREATGDDDFLCERIVNLRDCDDYEFEFEHCLPSECPVGSDEDVTEEAREAARKTAAFRAAHDGKSETELNGYVF